MSKKKPLPQEPIEAEIGDLSHDGRGVAHVDGKAVFVQGALAGERVRFRLTRRQRRHDEGEVVEVLSASPDRVTPRCAHFGLCGGCALQHLDPAAQIRMKQEVLAEALRRIGKVSPETWLPPLVAEHWGYRRKARLGVRYVAKKGRVLVGFRERRSSFVADLERCEVLHPAVGERLTELAELIGSLSIRERVAQIEMAQGDGPVVLIFRVLEPPTPGDIELLHAFAARTGLHVYLQPGGIETVAPLPGQQVELSYALPAPDATPVVEPLPTPDINLVFGPNDFTQVNLELNRLMVARALERLDPGPDDRVLDLFCGLGNFTLPIARRAAFVLGVEGDAGLVERARANAEGSGLDDSRVRFERADLYTEAAGEDPAAHWPWTRQAFDLALIDPPRSGALQVLDPLVATGIRRLVYVSCYPGTLARDAGHLVEHHGFRLVAAGAMDMFPHTAHVESMAVFER
ncbi:MULTISPECIES: 23S rRNA (uracil(1939)-C(5))-methyltransferase RlmD [Thiorhodovibrio]|uniref:23S rRNA (uracil(1939)-C(5))-methyltransferase RlmD n=1 Tax=Thiorhodovibrio TaxID=61593 RepID=UPI0019136501|nr:MULTISPECIES: 23S rRNA (uracil(1939)-C(5))-methyltransferase RlmD [Thiorhodovibrio]MBK5970453.1 23S rRNA (uracil(1939)-C(5))-methyltransferase [Thiorhodovibrio winogradskyi]WPL11423.1 23S rRNA (uracil(1939)-C(5))-methyltransferase RlmD [Thiorhodovibrio litoralis]